MPLLQDLHYSETDELILLKARHHDQNVKDKKKTFVDSSLDEAMILTECQHKHFSHWT